MPTLIALLSSGKGTWAEVSRIIQSKEWDKIFLITNQFGKDKFNGNNNTEFILINTFQETNQMIDSIKKQLKGKINDFEIALNIASGTGKEHMAVLESVLELGLNFRIVTINKENKLEILGLTA